MRTLRILAAYVLTVSIAGWMLADRPTLAEDRDVTVINMLPGQVMFEFVGQVINVPNTTTSDQFGYLSFIRGVSPIFNGTPQNEATAKFTFFRATTTERVISNGPLRIVNRTGTLTFYVDPASTPDFSNPSTFQSGSPILVARMRQQVVSDTANGVFTVVNENTITSTTAFSVGGNQFMLGQPGGIFRTVLTGQLNSTPPPTGYFAGYEIGVKNGEND